MRGEEPIAAVVYHNWQPDSGVLEMSIHSTNPRWMSRETVSDIMAVAFDAMRCQMVVARTSAFNDRTVRMLQGIGFQGTLMPRMRGRDEDEWLFTLTDDDWKVSRLNKDNRRDRVRETRPQTASYAMR